MGVAGGSTKSHVFAWRRVPVCRRKAPALVWIAEGGWGCGQVDEDTLTCLESGGCGGGCRQLDEDPRTRLQSGGCVGRSTKDPRARLRSGGGQFFTLITRSILTRVNIDVNLLLDFRLALGFRVVRDGRI